MRKYTTIIRAVDPADGQLKVWMGPTIQAESIEAARLYCDTNDLGYCEIFGEFIAEIGWDSALFTTRILDESINN